LGGRRLSKKAMLGTVLFAGHPPLFALLGFMMVCFFCNGLLFGNFSARSMEPVGHIAGVASAVIGSVSGTIGLAFGTLFGRAYDGTVLPLVGGFTTAGLLALTVTEIAERSVLAPRAPVPALESAAMVEEPVSRA